METGTLRIVYKYEFTDLVTHLEWSPDGQFIMIGVAKKAQAFIKSMGDPDWQGRIDEGMAVFAAGPADACERDIPWTGSVVFDGGVYASQALTLIIEGELTEGSTYEFPTEQGLNGGLLCNPSPEAQAAVDGAFGLLASFDDTLYGELGAISGAAYGG